MGIVSLDHVQVAAPRSGDVERLAREFYGGLLGLREIEKPEILKKNGGVWFSLGAGELHVGLEEPFSPARKAHPAFGVAGIDEMRSMLERAGVPMAEAEPLPGVKRFYVYDPFGNRIELLEKVGGE